MFREGVALDPHFTGCVLFSSLQSTKEGKDNYKKPSHITNQIKLMPVF